jgi:Fe-S cluster assembly ATP-binding protein
MKLHIKDFSVYNSDKLCLVDRATFCLESGKVYILQGKNGAGKSSLMLGLLKHPKLQVETLLYELGGVSLLELTTDEIARKGIFLANQHVPEVPGVEVIQVLHAAHLSCGGTSDILTFKDELEQTLVKIGIDTRYIERDLFAGFSGGEKKMLQCIFALALRPKFVLFDEIDSGVDAHALSLVYATISYLKVQGTGVLVISHQSHVCENLNADYTFEFSDKTIKNPNC